jgi:two-component system phosphate regulon sensor histidine kinase PhoR
LSRLEARGGPAEKSVVDVAGLLAALRKEVLAQVEPAPPIEIDAQADTCLLGSETELHSVASNLVWNAVKYTPPSGSIQVRWWADARGGHLSVKDTGIGIAPEHLPRLTERFYRVDAGRSRKLGGSGLGLSIVKHALQRHDGWLEVESVEGKGSSFTCHFPAARVGRTTP